MTKPITKPIHLLIVAAVLLPLAGCSQQYNGTLGFKGNEAVLAEAKRYHADREDAMPDGDEGDSPALKSMGPVASAVPQKHVAGDGAQFTAPTDVRGHGGEQAVSAADAAAANPAKRHTAPLNLFGDLPGHRAAVGHQGSPLDSPGNIEQVTFVTEGADFDPEIDPSGKFILFASTRHRDSADIYLQKIGGTTVTQLTNDPAKDIMPTFSPDGMRVAFASDRGGNWDIYLMDVSGGKATQLTTGSTHDLHPSFSPDGSKLVYCSYGAKSGQWELVVLDVANPAQRQIIGHGLFPQWSPKGRQIVFQRAREKGTRWFSVWTVDYIDGEARRATEIIAANNAAAITPAWSPDGEHLVFSTVMDPDAAAAGATGNKQVNADVWVVALDGSGRVNLTNSQFANLQPVWSKTGAIYFVSNRGKDGVESVWSLRPQQALNIARPTTGNHPATAATSEKGEPTAAVETKE